MISAPPFFPSPFPLPSLSTLRLTIRVKPQGKIIIGRDATLGSLQKESDPKTTVFPNLDKNPSVPKKIYRSGATTARNQSALAFLDFDIDARSDQVENPTLLRASAHILKVGSSLALYSLSSSASDSPKSPVVLGCKRGGGEERSALSHLLWVPVGVFLPPYSVLFFFLVH